jgi:hypothetical protein
MKQTAVEWLVEQITNGTIPAREAIKQAKKMEKKQIMDAWLITKPTTFNNWRNQFEQYYNETFKSE